MNIGPEKNRARQIGFYVLISLLLIATIWAMTRGNPSDSLKYSEVVELFEKNKVEKFAIDTDGNLTMELREEYNYEGPDGRRCYSAGDLLLGVSSRGLEFMSRPRLIESAALSEDEARERAERFLERLGYENLELYAGETGGGAASFRFAPTQDGVPRPDDALTLSVALDDGTVCAFRDFRQASR